MTGGDVLDISRDAIYTLIIVAGPVMGIGLAVGLVIAFFQALTQIQEITLTFVPKLAAIVIVFWMSMGFMTQTLVSFFQATVLTLIIGGN